MSKAFGFVLFFLSSFAYGTCFYDLESYKAGNCDLYGRPTIVFSCKAYNEIGHPIRQQVFCHVPGDPYYESYLAQESCFASFGTYIENLKTCSSDGDIPPVKGITYVDNTANACGSVVRTDNQVLNEYVNLAGIDFPLVYSSEKVSGRKTWNTLNIPVSILESNPANLPTVTADIIEVTVAGKAHSVNLQPGTNGTYEFIWDGLDSNNLPVTTSIGASVFATQVFDEPFCTVLVIPLGEHVVVSNSAYGGCGYRFPRTNRSAMTLGSVFLSEFGIGGWEFAIHHKYDELRKTLFLGDGTSFPAWRETKSNNEKWVVSKDRSEVYVFLNDRHIRTLDALTGTSIHEFNYNNSGNLISISDKYNNVVTIQYSGNSPVSITSPKGHVTNLEVNSNGYLSKITSLNAESYSFSYTSTGLLLSFENPNGVISTMTYDDKGNLLSDSSEAGNSLLFSKTEGRNGKIISQNSALSRQTLHTLSYTEADIYIRSDQHPSGFNQSYLFQPADNYTSISQSNSVSRNSYFTDDSRFPSSKITTVANFNDAGRNMATSYQEQSSLSDSQDPYSYTNLIKTWTINSKNFKSTYNKNTKSEVFETPQGRKVTVQMNSLNDPSSVQFSSLALVNINYNTDGSISNVSQDDRTTSYTYNANGWIETITNALGEVTRYTYDLAGRVIGERLGDNRLIKYKYDSNGNLTSVTPPFGSEHEMSFNGFDFLGSYIPPTIASQPTTTNYVYSNDKELTEIHRPDGLSATFQYNSVKGNLDAILLPNGNRNFNYYNGVITDSTSEDFVSHYYQFAGSKISNDSMYVNGKPFILQYNYNNDFLVSNENLSTNFGSSSVSYSYDHDNLLLSAGAQTYTRDAQTGYINSMLLGSIQQNFGYSSNFGELLSLEASTSGQNIYSQNFTRDKLGRIKTSTEQYGTQADSQFTYNYDKAGRLISVLKDGNAHSSYTYDYNGNRIGQTVNGTTLSGAYSPTMLSLGSEHSCALTNSGVKCWGEGSYGSLGYRNIRDIGDNETSAAVNFVRLGNIGVNAVTSGDRHNCAKYLNREVRCWGENTYGQLGLGNTITIGDDEHPATEPYVNTISKVLLMASGASHNCVVQTENKVSCWGLGTSGQLGYGNTNTIGDDELPIVAGFVDTGVTNKIIQLAAGDAHTCLLAANGRVKCWGSNSHNQLGSRTIGVNIGDDETPSAFGFLNIGETVKQIAAAGDHTCALMETGKLKCWGRNDYGQLGLGNTTTLTTAIKLHPYVDVGEDVKSVSTGRNSTCVVTVTGQVKCWGLNDAGQLGLGNLLTLGDDEAVSTIQNISLGTSPAISVQVGDKHACAILEDKSVSCWGSGSSGRLGYANTNSIGDNELPNSAGFLQGLSLEGIKYDEQDRLLAFGTKTFTYNLNGDLLTETDSSTGISKTFEYDVFGNLKKVVLPTKTINYKVDVHNRRVAKLDGTNVVEYYVWNDSSQLIGVADSSGALITRFVYGSKAHSPDYMVKSGIDYQIVSNHLGSPVAVIDVSSGVVAQEISYDEFGNILSDSSPGFIPFGFAGCLYDHGTNLCRFGARDYNASIGRWLSKDPILFGGQDINLYGYVLQNPINLIDPSGLVNKKNQVVSNPWTDSQLNNNKGGFGGGGGGSGSSGSSACYSPKIASQMQTRGWTHQMIEEAKLTQGIPTQGKLGPATRYVHPGSGQSIVIDDNTGEVFHVGGPGFKY